MSNRKCGKCFYWNTTITTKAHGKDYNFCGCGKAQGAVIGNLETTCDFGCDFWQERELTLKEKLVEYLWTIDVSPHVASDLAGDIIAIFEEHQGQ